MKIAKRIKSISNSQFLSNGILNGKFASDNTNGLPPNILDKNTLKARMEGKLPPLPELPDFKVGASRKESKLRNPKDNILNFQMQGLEISKTRIQVFSMGNSYFSINECWYPGSVILFPNQIFLWDIETPDEITAHSFDILDIIVPRPVGVIIGTGEEKFDLDESVYARFEQRHMRVDVVPTVEIYFNLVRGMQSI